MKQSDDYLEFPLSLRLDLEYVGFSSELLIFIPFIDLNANTIFLGTLPAIGEQTAYHSGASDSTPVC